MSRIVVGVGDAASAQPAVVWAAAEAQRRGWALHLLRAEESALMTGEFLDWYATEVVEEMDQAARAVLEEMRLEALEVAAELAVTTEVVHERPRRALLAAGQTAGMVVTGARSGGGRGLSLGSTAAFLTAHAPCPVGVVRAVPAAGARGVVVGHDGSTAAEAAVTFAAEEAQREQEPLTVVRAWQLTSIPPRAVDGEVFQQRVRRSIAQARRAVEDVAERLRQAHPGLDVRAQLVENLFASEALLGAAAQARLLVVGARGHGTFAALLLGSTSRTVLHNATGPVVVVPDPARRREPREHSGEQLTGSS